MDTSRPISCLIAEDEPIIALDLEEILRKAGFIPRWFASMERALGSLKRSLPDLAIVDVHLRDGPCTDLARELKRLSIPFIVHSGMPPGDSPPDLRDVPWLTKPAEPDAILSMLNTLILRR